MALTQNVLSDEELTQALEDSPWERSLRESSNGLPSSDGELRSWLCSELVSRDECADEHSAHAMA